MNRLGMLVGLSGSFLLALGLFLPSIDYTQASPVGLALAIVRRFANDPTRAAVRPESLEPLAFLAFIALASVAYLLGFVAAARKRPGQAAGVLALVAVAGMSLLMFRPAASGLINPASSFLGGPAWGLGVLVLGGVLLFVAPTLSRGRAADKPGRQ
jgi:hypothetical protein